MYEPGRDERPQLKRFPRGAGERTRRASQQQRADIEAQLTELGVLRKEDPQAAQAELTFT